ncbi:MAG: hypothetical protein AAB434_05625 [Planctomycetota bacterium]
MRRSTWAFFWIFLALLVLTPIVWMMDTGEEPALKPYIELASKIRHSYRCGAITIKETGPKEATRLSISYVVGENPTVADPATEMKKIGDLAIMVYTASPVVGVDIERKVPRGTGGCEQTFDAQEASIEKKARPK